MSRLFDDASSEYLEVDSTPVTAAPLTIAAWARSNDDANGQAVCFIGDKDSADRYFSLSFSGNLAGDPIRFVSRQGTAATVDTSTGYTANVWHHVCGIELATDSRAVYIDGGSKGTDATNKTPAGADRVSIGRHGDLTPGAHFSGDVAEVGIWNRALSDAEVSLLAKGFPASFFPSGLVAYWPLRDSSLVDEVGGLTLTATGTSVSADHPHILNHGVALHELDASRAKKQSIWTLGPEG